MPDELDWPETVEEGSMKRGLAALAGLFILVFGVFALTVLAGCSSVGGAKVRIADLRQRIGTTTEKVTSVTIVPTVTNITSAGITNVSQGMVTTNITLKELYNSPALDMLKSLGGMAKEVGK